MRITALQSFHHRGLEVRPGDTIDVADEYGIELTQKRLAKIDARDLSRLLNGRRMTTTFNVAPADFKIRRG